MARDCAGYTRHLADIGHALATSTRAASPPERASRLVIEFGQRFCTLQIHPADGMERVTADRMERVTEGWEIEPGAGEEAAEQGWAGSASD